MENPNVIAVPVVPSQPESTPMPAEPLALTAMGFWLPCGRTNFFNHKDDQTILDPSKQNNTVALDAIDLTIANKNGQEKNLQSSVFRRMCYVLRTQPEENGKDYTRVFYRIPPHRKPEELDESDPDTAVFVCPQVAPTVWLATPRPTHLLLLVNDEGFYLWLAVHPRSSDVRAIQDGLRQYIAEQMIGGGFYLHEESELKGYRDNKTGILNFFQLNLILEGLHNFMFDDRVYFYHGMEQDEELLKWERNYSLGNFARLVTAVVRLGTDDATPEKAALLRAADALVAPSAPTGQAEMVELLIAQCMNQQTRRDLLRRFLRATSAETLQPLKWRLERCRRALLQDMINVIHLQRDLFQVVCPDESAKTGMTDATEDQLRGYSMLISAKLPLIRNVQRYAKQVTEEMVHREQVTTPPSVSKESPQQISRASEPGGAPQIGANDSAPIARAVEQTDPRQDTAKDPQQTAALAREKALGEIMPYIHSWDGLYDAIGDNIRGLENAVTQARNERTFEEEHRIRAEQEAVAEIERIRHYTGGFGGGGDESALGFSENALALLSLVATFLTAQNIITLSDLVENISERLGGTTPADVIAFVGVSVSIAIIGIVGYLLLFYPIVHSIFVFAKGIANRFMKFEKRHYYEFDIRCDKPLHEKQVQGIIERKEFRLAKPEYLPAIVRRIEGRGYRAEIENSEEGEFRFHALYQVNILRPKHLKRLKFLKGIRYLKHIKRVMRVSHLRHSQCLKCVTYLNRIKRRILKTWDGFLTRVPVLWRLFFTRLSAHVTIEFLQHRLTGLRKYLYRECRVVTTNSVELSKQQLDALQGIVAEFAGLDDMHPHHPIRFLQAVYDPKKQAPQVRKEHTPIVSPAGE